MIQADGGRDTEVWKQEEWTNLPTSIRRKTGNLHSM